MNNRAFTLIELLIVVAIMGVLGTVITVSLTTMLNNAEQNKCSEFVKEVEEAACVYSSLSNKLVVCNRNSCPPIALDILVKEGLIKSEVDACTGKDIDLTQTVTVIWDENGEKNCIYNGVKKYER